MDKEALIKQITEQVLAQISVEAPSRQSPQQPSPLEGKILIPVGVSNRHLHVSQRDLDVLYGKGYQLQVRNPLRQPGEFASKETVTLVGPRHAIEGVRILGPVRDNTQVEIALTDAIRLGIDAPVRVSGSIEGTPGITVVGPEGSVMLTKGVIRANRHIHLTPKEAQQYGLEDKQIVAVKTIDTDKPTLFYDVMVRVLEKAALEFHIDTDDGNAAGLNTNDMVELVK